jgi:hypothetical protein
VSGVTVFSETLMDLSIQLPKGLKGMDVGIGSHVQVTENEILQETEQKIRIKLQGLQPQACKSFG